MSAAYYGTHPEVLSRLLSGLTPEERRRVRYLDAGENAWVEERSLNKYPQTGGSLAFSDDSIVEQREAATEVEAAELLAESVRSCVLCCVVRYVPTDTAVTGAAITVRGAATSPKPRSRRHRPKTGAGLRPDFLYEVVRGSRRHPPA
ncbi:hypothetical protein ACWCXE_06060 [Streptomyces sp. NPDC001780]